MEIRTKKTWKPRRRNDKRKNIGPHAEAWFCRNNAPLRGSGPAQPVALSDCADSMLARLAAATSPKRSARPRCRLHPAPRPPSAIMASLGGTPAARQGGKYLSPKRAVPKRPTLVDTGAVDVESATRQSGTGRKTHGCVACFV